MTIAVDYAIINGAVIRPVAARLTVLIIVVWSNAILHFLTCQIPITRDVDSRISSKEVCWSKLYLVDLNRPKS
jgi:hypothetical protein